MLRQTSLLAYRSLETSKVNERQRQVLNTLEDIYPANNRQISAHSHLPINVVTPRMGELLRKGMIEEAYRDKDPVTGRQSIYWRPASRAYKEFGDAA